MRIKFFFVLFALASSTVVAAQNLDRFIPLETQPDFQIVPEENKIFFWEGRTGKVVVYDTATWGEVDRFRLGTNNVGSSVGPIDGFHYSPNENRYYVLTKEGHLIRVYDQNKTRIRDYTLPSYNHSDLWVDSKAQKAFVRLGGEYDYVKVVDLRNGAVTTLFKSDRLSHVETMLDEENGLFLMVNDTTTSSGIDIYSTSTLSKVRSIQLSDPKDIIDVWMFNFKPPILCMFVGYQGSASPGTFEKGERLLVNVSTGEKTVLDTQWLNRMALSDDLSTVAAYKSPSSLNVNGEFTIYHVNDGSVPDTFWAYDAGVENWDDSYGLKFHNGELWHIVKGGIKVVQLPEHVTPPTPPQSLVFPRVIQDHITWTGVGLSSDSENDIRGYMKAKAFTHDGRLVPEVFDITNPKDLDFAGASQMAKFPQEIFGQGLVRDEVMNSPDQIQSVEIEFPQGGSYKGFALTGDVGYQLWMDGLVAVDPKTAGKTMYIHGATEILTTKENQEVKFTKFNDNGDVLGEYTGSAGNRLSHVYNPLLYSSPTSSLETYYKVESQSPLIGYGIVGGWDESYLPGQYAEVIRKELVFAHNATLRGGTTLLYIVNPSDQLQTVDLYLYREDGSLEKQIARNIRANGMLWGDTAELFLLPQGKEQTGYIKAVGRGVGIVGWIRFQIGGIAEAALASQIPVVKAEFSHVAQVKPTKNVPMGMNHGLTIVNRGDAINQVQLQALLPDGTITATAVVELAPGEKLARHLNAAEFFGPNFNQAGGRLKVESLNGQPFVAFCLFYQTFFEPRLPFTMAAIPGQ